MKCCDNLWFLKIIHIYNLKIFLMSIYKIKWTEVVQQIKKCTWDGRLLLYITSSISYSVMLAHLSPCQSAWWVQDWCTNKAVRKYNYVIRQNEKLINTDFHLDFVLPTNWNIYLCLLTNKEMYRQIAFLSFWWKLQRI